MRAVGRVVVGLLACVGAVAVVGVVLLVFALRSAGPVDIGEQSATPAPAPSTAAGALVADNLKADVTVPFSTVQQHVDQGVTISDAGEGTVRVVSPMTLLGRQWRVSADGTLDVDGADVIVHPVTVRVAGMSALDGVVSALARQSVAVRVPMTGLPQGMRVTGVRSTPQGLRASVEGSGVPLPAP